MGKRWSGPLRLLHHCRLRAVVMKGVWSGWSGGMEDNGVGSLGCMCWSKGRASKERLFACAGYGTCSPFSGSKHWPPCILTSAGTLGPEDSEARDKVKGPDSEEDSQDSDDLSDAERIYGKGIAGELANCVATGRGTGCSSPHYLCLLPPVQQLMIRGMAGG